MVCRYNAESHLILQLHALWAIQGQRRLCVSTHNRFRGKLRRLLQSKANKTISIQIHWWLGWEFTTPHFTPCFYHQGAALRSVGLTLRLESSSSVPASACSQPLLCPTLPQQQELLKMLQPLKAEFVAEMNHLITVFYCITVPLPSGRQDHIQSVHRMLQLLLHLEVGWYEEWHNWLCFNNILSWLNYVVKVSHLSLVSTGLTRHWKEKGPL